jgi:signal transduction histidine kinase
MHRLREPAPSGSPEVAPAAFRDTRLQEGRINLVERDLGLPARTIFLAVLFYYLFMANWMTEVRAMPGIVLLEESRHLAQTVVQAAFLVYVAISIATAFVLLGKHKLRPGVIQWVVFSIALVDGLFLAGMVTITGGLNSSLYWLYLLLIVRNCASVPAPAPQLVLNSLMCLFYFGAALLDMMITQMDLAEMKAVKMSLDEGYLAVPGGFVRPLALRILLLICVSVWCYGMQVVLERHRRALEEQRELALRSQQLEASGRLAAEIAHQLKNPLAIINNAAFTLQRTLKEGKTITQQIKLIREEVERSDRLITELMGYAKLADGRVEDLDVKEELERAIQQVFPPAVKYEIQVHRDFAPALPHLQAQRNHLNEVFVNVMQNAREVMHGRGNLWVKASYGEDYSVVITIADDGPGIAPELLGKVFEPYFTTREKGSGLGLAIVKHNTELYGGRVWVESELGKGSRFVLQFPARTLVRLRK